jgi:hypothetical protein
MWHHDSAPAHVLLFVCSYLAKHDTRCAPSTLFSGLSPSKLFLFPKLKTTLKGCRFQPIEAIQENVLRELRAITESVFQEAFQQWKKCCEWCIASRGVYLEGDST